jgi:multicomponent Na+:H+ antiporter subunit C
MSLLPVWHYVVVVALMMLGLYIVIAKPNYVKKLMGLSLFQVSVIMLYVSMGRITGGTAPIYILDDGVPRPFVLYTNPVPHVLMLTAIVVGVATMAVGLSLVVRIREAYGSTEEDVVAELDRREVEEARHARDGRGPRGGAHCPVMAHLPILMVLVPLLSAPVVGVHQAPAGQPRHRHGGLHRQRPLRVDAGRHPRLGRQLSARRLASGHRHRAAHRLCGRLRGRHREHAGHGGHQPRHARHTRRASKAARSSSTPCSSCAWPASWAWWSRATRSTSSCSSRSPRSPPTRWWPWVVSGALSRRRSTTCSSARWAAPSCSSASGSCTR